MRAAIIVAAVLLATPAAAQVQTGTGANGGLCFGVNCGDNPPPSIGIGANGGTCFGPNCGTAPYPAPSYQTPEPQISAPSQSFSYDPPARLAPLHPIDPDLGATGPPGYPRP